jgi:hypothetical protein
LCRRSSYNDLTSRSFLFLGYELSTWFDRQLVLDLNRMLNPARPLNPPPPPAIDFGEGPGVPFEVRRGAVSWAIDFHPSQLATQFWNAIGIKSYDLDAREFTRQLREEL